MAMTTSSSSARRTIDVTCKHINRKKSSRFPYTRIHVKASEQGLSFLPFVRVILVTSAKKSLHSIERNDAKRADDDNDNEESSKIKKNIRGEKEKNHRMIAKTTYVDII